MNPPDATLFVARVLTVRDVAEAYDIATSETGPYPDALWFDADSDRASLEWYCPSPDDAHERLGAFEAAARLHGLSGAWQTEVRCTPREDWAESWKRFFHPAKVSPRVWICPSWEPGQPAPGDVVVEIDPGMSFGTGQHATTRGCIVFLDRLAAPQGGRSLIDAGCGSGILAIAAARLGYLPITAFDNDPLAAAIARENAAHNRVAGAIDIRTGDLAILPTLTPADVVVANILAPVLIEGAPLLVAALRPGPASRLILSGLLRDQAAEVLAAYAALGLELEERLDIDEWSTLCLRKP